VRSYKALTQVERAFRSLKTVDLKLPPGGHIIWLDLSPFAVNTQHVRTIVRHSIAQNGPGPISGFLPQL
jgi:hypothetical protein